MDKMQSDYTGHSLDLRNNPWFFSKDYSIKPLTDDEDFYFLLQTKVDSSKFIRQMLKKEKEVFSKARETELTREEFKRNPRAKTYKKTNHLVNKKWIPLHFKLFILVWNL